MNFNKYWDAQIDRLANKGLSTDQMKTLFDECQKAFYTALALEPPLKTLESFIAARRNQITILVDDKQKMLECLLAEREAMKPYLDECIDVLISAGASADKIDRESFSHGVHGYLGDCSMFGKTPITPFEFVKGTLDQYSNIGLAECGFSRETYEKSGIGKWN